MTYRLAPLTTQYLRAFSRLIVIAWLLGPLSVSAQSTTLLSEEAKARVVAEIASWMAQREGIAQGRIEVLASDRRFRVPTCEGALGLDYVTRPTIEADKPANATVRASCDASDWSAVLRVNVNAQPQRVVFARGLVSGTLLEASHLIVAQSGGTPSQKVLSDLVGRSINRDVRAGEEIDDVILAQWVDVFVTTAAVRLGERIGLNDVRTAPVAFNEAGLQQRLTQEQLESAVARRDLREGTTLTLSDLQFASAALVATGILEQGSVFDASSFAARELFEQLPRDAVLDARQLQRATTKRRLTPGTVIRYSDIQMQPHVGAGENVQLTVTRGAISLTVDMIAAGDGYLGDKVELNNPESGESVIATVTGVGRARRD
ncbi:MAG: flagellar basal body P-ring formation chaperone FlgA [Gammaproteobacteria bacterium]|nr:flagellar basal body P-ring formation chaperone FlgA [Gammaproteobacteria bacterium]